MRDTRKTAVTKTATSAGRPAPSTRKVVPGVPAETPSEILDAHGFGPGREVFGLTFGAFSLIDLLDAVIDRCGAEHLDIATWIAAGADATTVAEWVDRGRLRSTRWLVDRSFIARAPQVAALVQSRFGAEALRVTRTHAKFALLRNGGYDAAVLSSMNLNRNPRLESYLVTTDPAVVSALSEIVDRAFASAAPAAMDEAESRAVLEAMGVERRTKKKRRIVKLR